MTDPFNVTVNPNPLINISTWMHAPKDIEVSLTKAFDNGATMAKGTEISKDMTGQRPTN
jgi:hypothetical protein